MDLLILGGGGEKLVRAWQDDEILKEEAEWMKYVSQKIYQRIKDKDIYFTNDDRDIEGDLIFEL